MMSHIHVHVIMHFTHRQISVDFTKYLILVEEHLQLSYADTQVCLVELIGDVPTQGAELPPLLDQGVEETQSE